MAHHRSTMMEPQIETLLDHVDSKFTLVTLSSKRGRQINSYFNQLGEGLGSIVPPQVTSTARKPLSIALEEIAAGKITYIRVEEEEGEGGEEVTAESEQTGDVASLGAEPGAVEGEPETPDAS